MQRPETAQEIKELILVSAISKAGGRYVVGLASKYKVFAERHLGEHVKIVLTPIL